MVEITVWMRVSELALSGFRGQKNGAETYWLLLCLLEAACASTCCAWPGMRSQTSPLLLTVVILFLVSGRRLWLQHGRGFVHSGVAGALHKCSPMREISTSFPQLEHLMVGKNVDSRGKAMMCW